LLELSTIAGTIPSIFSYICSIENFKFYFKIRYPKIRGSQILTFHMGVFIGKKKFEIYITLYILGGSELFSNSSKYNKMYLYQSMLYSDSRIGQPG
jgi:hypothetical protein